jgi:hypothetical protein
MIEFYAHADVKGPLTDGRALRALNEYAQDIPKVLARMGARLVVSYSKSSFKNVTPYYWNQVRAHPTGGNAWEVDDGGVIYGPWLEGVGSRNAPVTRFRGYGMYAKAARVVDGAALGTANERLRIYLPRMN